MGTVEAIKDWKPNRGPQAAFLMCRVFEILYGGAKGGGKSEAAGPKAVKHCLMYGQFATVLILRKTMPDLRDLIKKVKPHCLRAGARYNKTEKTWTFPNGAQIIFGHLRDGFDPYWGQEYTMIIVDEVTRCIESEADYLMLLGSLRSSHGIPCQVILFSNPGGPGHGWVKERFMGVPPLTVQKDPETGLERVFIPAKLKDNPHLPQIYLAILRQMGPKEQDAFIEGNWSAFEGTVFQLEKGVHVWTWAQFNLYHNLPADNRKMPADWNLFRTMDWGYAKPFSIYWYAVDFNGRAWVYREWAGVAKDNNKKLLPNVGLRLEPEKVATKIASIELEAGETKVTGWAGPDIGQAVRGDHAGPTVVAAAGGQTIESHFRKHKIFWQFWTATAGSRLAGKMALHQRLYYERSEETGEIMEMPGLIFIDEETPNAQRTLPALEYDEHQVELVDSDGEDHDFDSIAGFCKMKPWAPKKKQEVKPKGWRGNSRMSTAGGVT